MSFHEGKAAEIDDFADAMSLKWELPSRLRLLCISPREPSWVNLTLQLDAEHCHQPQFRWVSTPNEALTVLRDVSFDCVLISDGTGSLQDRVAVDSPFDTLHMVRAIRASGGDDPIVLLATQLEELKWAQFCELDCEILITHGLWESKALVPVVKRAVANRELSRENHRLEIADHRRLVRERDEAEHLLVQQRQIIQELETLTEISLEVEENHGAPDSLNHFPVSRTERILIPLPPEINDYYQELLRTYVIMGSGSMGNEISKLAELIAEAGMTPGEALELHLERLETLVRGLGNRSTRHVMARADLLALELMVHLGECYQQRITD